VNHKNGKSWDNRIENLEWSTKKENTTHGVLNNLFTGNKIKPKASIYKGVVECLYQGQKRKKWRAEIRSNYKLYRGPFRDNEESAYEDYTNIKEGLYGKAS